jgi:ABC-2 type transport system ATP-binding protein
VHRRSPYGDVGTDHHRRAPGGVAQRAASLGTSLSQERAFYLRLTARENLLFFGRLRLGSKKLAARAVGALEEELLLGSILDRRMAECSTGMVQQVGIARAFLGDPLVAALDEPTRSLDEAAIDRFWAALERRPEIAAIVATHRAEDATHATQTLDLGS